MRYFKIIKEEGPFKSTVYAVKEKQYFLKVIPMWEYLCEEENGFTKMVKEKMTFNSIWDAYDYLFDFHKYDTIDITYNYSDSIKFKVDIKDGKIHYNH